MNLHDLAKRLGGELGRNGIVTCPGPGHSPKDRSLSVWFDGDDLRVYSFADDAWQACKDHVRERAGLPAWRSNRKTEKPQPRLFRGRHHERTVKADVERRIAQAQRLWCEAEDPRAAPVFAYLNHRGLPGLLDDQIPTFRFHPQCPFSGERVPALLARFAPINDPGIETEPTAILRVRLDRYDGDRRKLALGPSRGQVLKLNSDLSLAGLGLVEGPEKALALNACGWRPIWCASGTATMRSFPVVPGVESLTIFNDADDAGRNAALACAARWHDAGREVRVLQPPTPFRDWDDWYREGGQS